MNDLNWYLMNKDHDYINSSATTGIGTGGPVVISSKPTPANHNIGMNPPPATTGPSNGDDKATKLAKIKPSMSRERVGLNPNQLLINLQNYNFK